MVGERVSTLETRKSGTHRIPEPADAYTSGRFAQLDAFSWWILFAGFAIGIALIFVSEAFGWTDTVFKAVGASVIASVITYALFATLIETSRANAQLQIATRNAAEYAEYLFTTLFHRSIPAQIFDSSTGFRKDFREAFVDLLRNSKTYEVKGTNLRVASYRLTKLWRAPEVAGLDTVVLIMTDPREAPLLSANLAIQKSGAADDGSGVLIQDQEIAKLREEIFTTWFSLFDIRRYRETEVFLHHDLPFYRSEHFDTGMLLSYYLSDKTARETLRFDNDSRMFKVYREAKNMSKRLATTRLLFAERSNSKDAISTEDQLMELLKSFDYGGTLDDLRENLKTRIADLDKELGAADMRDGELF